MGIGDAKLDINGNLTTTLGGDVLTPPQLFAVFTGITECSGCFPLYDGHYGKWTNFDFAKSLCLCFNRDIRVPGIGFDPCCWLSEIFTGPILEIYGGSDCSGDPIAVITNWYAQACWLPASGIWVVTITSVPDLSFGQPVYIFYSEILVSPAGCDEDFSGDNFNVGDCDTVVPSITPSGARDGSVAVTIDGC